MHVATIRARLAIVLLGIGLLGADAVCAQDPRASSALQAARAFLVLTDHIDGEESWQVAGKQFQSALTDKRWTEALDKVRTPLGPLVERATLSTEFTTNFPGAMGEGDYALLTFRTRFAHRADARETVTLQREADGVWRVIGYVIR
jgi:Protein of unknown function (DUF4019)